jgi:septal ring factor EnvC (AmiA/AmiB activator)
MTLETLWRAQHTQRAFYHTMWDDMQKQLTNRLRELKAEFEAGQAKLTEIESQASNLRSMILRISGAIQVLEEELAKANGSTASADPGVETKGDNPAKM